MSVAIGWRTAIDVIATTPPPPLFPHRRHDVVTHRDRAQAVELERLEVLIDVVCAKSPGGGPPALATRMSMPPSAAARVADEPGAPSVVDTSATIGTASPAMRSAAAAIVSSLAAADRDPHAFAAPVPSATPKPRPFDAAATAARLPEFRDPPIHSWNRCRA